MAGKREMISPAILISRIGQFDSTADFARHLREPSLEKVAGARESLHRDPGDAARTAVLIEQYLQPADYLWVVCRKCPRAVEPLLLAAPMSSQNRTLRIRIDGLQDSHRFHHHDRSRAVVCGA